MNLDSANGNNLSDDIKATSVYNNNYPNKYGDIFALEPFMGDKKNYIIVNIDCTSAVNNGYTLDWNTAWNRNEDANSDGEYWELAPHIIFNFYRVFHFSCVMH